MSRVSVPPPRFGREDQVSIQNLLDVKTLIQQWKGKLCRLRSQLGMVEHTKCTDRPKIKILRSGVHIYRFSPLEKRLRERRMKVLI